MIEELLGFIDNSPVSFFAVRNISAMLLEKGFVKLSENEEWRIENGGKYFSVRNDSSLIAFRVPERDYRGIMAAAAHCDSPSFRIKPNAERTDEYVRLDVEGYGGMIMSSWFDRPLSAAGRVMRRTGSGVRTELVNIDRDSLIIPNLAIHMERDTNSGHNYNVQKELLPLYGTALSAGGFYEEIGDNVGYDMYLYNRMKGIVWGKDNELISSPRIDDLECAFLIARAFADAPPTDALQVIAVFDNEEVGSSTRHGAGSDFLRETIERVNDALGCGRERLMRAKAAGFMVSADNAHALHPNYTEKACPANSPVLNGGVVIKHSANKKYTTDALSEAIFREICSRAGVPYQFFTNRSDMTGGSTLGNISNERFSINSVDIGLAQLAMHSAYETAGAKDAEYFYSAMRGFFSSMIEINDNEFVITEV